MVIRVKARKNEDLRIFGTKKNEHKRKVNGDIYWIN